MIKNGLRIFYDDFSEKVKNIHDEMKKHHSYKKKRVHQAKKNQRLFEITSNFKLRQSSFTVISHVPRETAYRHITDHELKIDFMKTLEISEMLIKFYPSGPACFNVHLTLYGCYGR